MPAIAVAGSAGASYATAFSVKRMNRAAMRCRKGILPARLCVQALRLVAAVAALSLDDAAYALSAPTSWSTMLPVGLPADVAVDRPAVEVALAVGLVARSVLAVSPSGAWCAWWPP